MGKNEMKPKHGLPCGVRLIAGLGGAGGTTALALAVETVAELEFTAKARALDVIYTRFAQIHCSSDQSPHSEFHGLAVRIQKLAIRRNELVHSFYHLLVTVDGELALERKPTRLKPSEGVREQPPEDILPDRLISEIAEMRQILAELEKYRLSAIDALYPP